MTNTKTPRFCDECKNEIPAGSRSDKRFCGDKCRNDYNNRLAKPTVLTLRQHYAGLAMQGLLSSGKCYDSGHLMDGLVIRQSVRLADALVAELQKTNSNG